MQKVLLGIIFSFFVQNLSAQTVTVINENTQTPIEGVLIFTEVNGEYLISNQEGQATGKMFSEEHIFIFSHNSFDNDTLSLRDLEERNFIIELEESVVILPVISLSVRGKYAAHLNQVAEVKKKEVILQNPQTTADLLGLSGQVFIQKSQLGGGSPMMRGFSANRVLLVVDGVRMNNAIFRSGNLQNVISLDANTINQAEVILGPGSVIYGSDAIGGVMHFQTLRPWHSGKENWGKLHFSGNTLTRYSSANQEKTGHLDFNLGYKNWAFLTSFTFSDYEDLRMGKQGNEEYRRLQYVERQNGEDRIIQNSNPNIQRFSGYHQWNLMQKISFEKGAYDKPKWWIANYAFHYSELSDVPRYDRLIETQNDLPRNAEWYYGPQVWQMHQANFFWKDNYNEVPLFDQVNLNFAYQNYQESRNDRRFQSETLRSRKEEVDIFSVNLDFYKWDIAYGFEYVDNRVQSSGEAKSILTQESSPIASRYPNGSTWRATSAYIANTFPIYIGGGYGPNRYLTFKLGLRYNWIQTKAKFDQTFFSFPFEEANLENQSLNGSLGIKLDLPKDWKLKWNFATGFRAPNVDDIGKIFDSEPGNVVVPNPDLQPETIYSADFTIEKYWGEWSDALHSESRISLSAFYSFLDNAMVRRNFQFNGLDSIVYDGTLSQVEAIQNVDNAQVYGLQFALEWHVLRHFIFKSYWNFTWGESKDDLPLRHVSPTFGSFHLLYNQYFFSNGKELFIDVYAQYNGEISFDDLALEERDKPHLYATNSDGNPYSPSWWTLNLKANYELTDFLQINAGVENLLDVRYRPYASGIVAPGRNFIISLRGSW